MNFHQGEVEVFGLSNKRVSHIDLVKLVKKALLPVTTLTKLFKIRQELIDPTSWKVTSQQLKWQKKISKGD